MESDGERECGAIPHRGTSGSSADAIPLRMPPTASSA
jgi:hypothetical protein